MKANDVVIEPADACDYEQRPSGFGVGVVPAAFILWNR